MPGQMLRNRIRASEEGAQFCAAAKMTTPEQMELSRLRAENKRVKMELEIAKNERRCSWRRTSFEIFLDRFAEPALSAVVAVGGPVGHPERL